MTAETDAILTSLGGSPAGMSAFKHSFSSVQEFEASALSYADVSTGDRFQIHIYAFEVAASAATNAHVQSAGGVKGYYRSAKSTAAGSPVIGPDGNASIMAFGIKGNGSNDDTIKMQAALATGHRNFRIPAGSTLLISDTLREATNGGALSLYGENNEHSIIKASPDMPMNAPLIWVGNSNGHGNYRTRIRDVRLDGSSRAIGLRLHEAGTSNVRDTRIVNAPIGIDAPGMIGSAIQDNEISGCGVGINLKRVPLGTPVNADDITATGSPQSLNTNINRLVGNWISGGKTAMRVEGGLVNIAFNTFQNVGTIDDDVVELVNANEAHDYGSGPVLFSNWFESATVRSLVRLTNTEHAKIEHGYMSTKAGCEQAIIGDSASNHTKISGVSFIGHGLATPTEGRTQNAVVYLDGKGTRLEGNRYCSFPSRTYAQLVKINRSPDANNIIMEQGQNGGTPMGIEFGNLQISLGATPIITKNPNTVGAFNAYIQGLQNYNMGSIVSAQTGTAYTLGLTNGSGTVTMNNAAANEVTIPTNASVTFTIGTVIDVVQIGAGATSVKASAGVTLNGVNGGTVAGPGQYKSLRLIKTAANTWVAV